MRRYLGDPIDARLFEKKFGDMLNAEGEWNLTVRRKDTDVFVRLVSLNKHHDGIGTEVSKNSL